MCINSFFFFFCSPSKWIWLIYFVHNERIRRLSTHTHTHNAQFRAFVVRLYDVDAGRTPNKNEEREINIFDCDIYELWPNNRTLYICIDCSRSPLSSYKTTNGHVIIHIVFFIKIYRLNAMHIFNNLMNGCILTVNDHLLLLLLHTIFCWRTNTIVGESDFFFAF